VNKTADFPFSLQCPAAFVTSGNMPRHSPLFLPRKQVKHIICQLVFNVDIFHE
jgi:hypothetical protein